MIKKLNFDAALTFLKGLILIVLGVTIMFWQNISVAFFILAFGIVTVFYAIFSALQSFVSRKKNVELWWVSLVEAVFSLLIGLLILLLNGLTSITLLYLVTLWVLFVGFFLVINVVLRKEDLEKNMLQIYVGVAATLFGIFAVLKPMLGILSYIETLSYFGIFLGIGFWMISVKSFLQNRDPSKSSDYKLKINLNRLKFWRRVKLSSKPKAEVA